MKNKFLKILKIIGRAFFYIFYAVFFVLFKLPCIPLKCFLAAEVKPEDKNENIVADVRKTLPINISAALLLAKGFTKRCFDFLKSYGEIKKSFAALSDKGALDKYNPYSDKVMDKLFEFDPKAQINDIDKVSCEGVTYHHIVPKSEASGEQLKSFDNLAPVSRAEHDSIEKLGTLSNGKKAESLESGVHRVAGKGFLVSFWRMLGASMLHILFLSFFTALFSAVKSFFEESRSLKVAVKGFLYKLILSFLENFAVIIPFSIISFVIIRLLGGYGIMLGMIIVAISIVTLFSLSGLLINAFKQKIKEKKDFIISVCGAALTVISVVLSAILQLNGLWFLGILLGDLVFALSLVLNNAPNQNDTSVDRQINTGKPESL